MSENKHLTPVWIIYADGKRLDVEHEGALRSITISDCLNGVSTFSIVFDTTEVKIVDKGVLSYGSEISVHLGYKDDIEEVFTGEVLGFHGMFPENGTEQVEVTGCNALHKLERRRRARSFEKKKASEVIKGLLEGYSLKGEVDDFGAGREFQTEENKTDYEYLMETAKAYGKQVFADGTTVYVKDEISVRSDEVIYEWGKSLISFDVNQNNVKQASEVNYIGWDELKNESFVGKAGMGDLPVKIGGGKSWSDLYKGGGEEYITTHIDSDLLDADEARQLAQGLLQSGSYSFCTAQGKGEGNYKLRPGMRVTVKYVGALFEGEYTAQTVTHRFEKSVGYITEFILKRNMCQ